MTMLLWITLGVVGIFVAISAYLYFNQRNMVFFPDRNLVTTPAQIGLTFEDVDIAVEAGERLHGWYVPGADSQNTAAFLFCHGNAGNISHRLETIMFLHDLGASVLIFDYRGYGRSDGSPSESNAYADARACYDWLISEKDCLPGRIFVFGRSLGGAVAVDLAAGVACAGLIVESSFTSAAAMARRMFPVFPTGLLLRYRFDSAEKIKSVSVPVLVIHSPHDELVPFEMGRELFRSANEPKKFLEITGDHNNQQYFEDLAYRRAFVDLLNSGL
ncbi:MAG: alpha/beta hydrolase [Candidatus Zixiibacteriota bacterium]|nr:MAG: alpha/beta hydrolase [candidate division Zixibacteria bacterium]